MAFTNGITELDEKILSCYNENKLCQERFYAMQQLTTVLEQILLQNFTCRLVHFGSVFTKLATNDSDLDLCLIVENAKMDKNKMLETLKIAYDSLYDLYYSNCFKMRFISNAVVPVIKMKGFQFSDYRIDVDITVNNFDGIQLSRLLKSYSDIEPAFQILVIVIKQWCKSKDIYDMTTTFNGCCLTYLVVHFLQSLSLLPVYQNFDEIQYDSAEDFVFKFENFTSDKQRSLSDLYLGFFEYYKKLDLTEKIISIKCGTISNRSKDVNHSVFVENPFDPSDNLAKVITVEGHQKIVEQLSKRIS